MEPVRGSLSPLLLAGNAAAHGTGTDGVRFFPHFPYHNSLYVSVASLLLSPYSDICIFSFPLGDSGVTWNKEDSPILVSSGNECHNFQPDAKKPISFTGTACIHFLSSSFICRHIIKVTGREEVHQALLASIAGSFEF